MASSLRGLLTGLKGVVQQSVKGTIESVQEVVEVLQPGPLKVRSAARWRPRPSLVASAREARPHTCGTSRQPRHQRAP